MIKKNGALTMTEAGPSRKSTHPGLFSGGVDVGRLPLEGRAFSPLSRSS